eukprot:COSAG01_NODE_5894_length_3965_cov_2.764615_6_plen_122_part_00
MFTLTTVRDGLSCLRIRYHSWGSTSGIIQLLKTRQKFWGADPQYGWPDPDFIYTGGQGCPNGRERAFPSWNRSMLTEIYLCHACSYHEIEDGSGAPGDPSDPSANQTNPPGQRCPGQSETE